MSRKADGRERGGSPKGLLCLCFCVSAPKETPPRMVEVLDLFRWLTCCCRKLPLHFKSLRVCLAWDGVAGKKECPHGSDVLSCFVVVLEMIWCRIIVGDDVVLFVSLSQ